MKINVICAIILLGLLFHVSGKTIFTSKGPKSLSECRCIPQERPCKLIATNLIFSVGRLRPVCISKLQLCCDEDTNNQQSLIKDMSHKRKGEDLGKLGKTTGNAGYGITPGVSATHQPMMSSQSFVSSTTASIRSTKTTAELPPVKLDAFLARGYNILDAHKQNEGTKSVEISGGYSTVIKEGRATNLSSPESSQVYEEEENTSVPNIQKNLEHQMSPGIPHIINTEGTPTTMSENSANSVDVSVATAQSTHTNIQRERESNKTYSYGPPTTDNVGQMTDHLLMTTKQVPSTSTHRKETFEGSTENDLVNPTTEQLSSYPLLNDDFYFNQNESVIDEETIRVLNYFTLPMDDLANLPSANMKNNQNETSIRSAKKFIIHNPIDLDNVTSNYATSTEEFANIYASNTANFTGTEIMNTERTNSHEKYDETLANIHFVSATTADTTTFNNNDKDSTSTAFNINYKYYSSTAFNNNYKDSTSTAFNNNEDSTTTTFNNNEDSTTFNNNEDSTRITINNSKDSTSTVTSDPNTNTEGYAETISMEMTSYRTTGSIVMSQPEVNSSITIDSDRYTLSPIHISIENHTISQGSSTTSPGTEQSFNLFNWLFP